MAAERWPADGMPPNPAGWIITLVASRRPARTTVDGEFMRLSDQDRTLWDRAMTAEGHPIVRRLVRRNRPGPYQLQASINAVHSVAASIAETDWQAILSLYDQLMAIAVAHVSGPQAALSLVEGVTAFHGAASGVGCRRRTAQPLVVLCHDLRRRLRSRWGNWVPQVGQTPIR